MRGNSRIQAVTEAFCALTYVQHTPVAIYHHFIDYIHLLCFAPVNVVLQSGGMRLFSVPQFTAPSQPDISSLLDRYEDPDSGVTIAVYGLHESARLRPKTIETLITGIRKRSPAAGNYLTAALTDGVFNRGEIKQSPQSQRQSISLDADIFLAATKRLGDRLSSVWKQYLSHEDLLQQLREPPGTGASSLQPVRIRASVKYVPASDYLRQITAAGINYPLRYAVYRVGDFTSVDTGSEPPAPPALEDLSLYGGHLQVAVENHTCAVTIPVHVGGTAWLVATLFPKSSSTAWREVLRFYSLALPRLAEEIRTIAQESFLEAVRTMFRTHAPWSTDRAWDLEQLNERLFQLSMLFPYPVVYIEDAPLNQADISPDGHPIRIIVQQEARPLPAELEYRPLSPRTVRDECMDELRVYEQQWVKQTDALVAGVYKIGHQLGHAVAPLQAMLNDAQRVLLKYRTTHQESLLDDLSQSVLHAGLIGEKANRKSLILDMLATATLENSARQTFLKPGKQAWRTDEPFVLDHDGIIRSAGEPWTFVGASPANLASTGFLSIEIQPWLHDSSHHTWRPADRFYTEFFHEILLNAGHHGKVSAERQVNVDVSVEHPTSSGLPQMLLVFENERRHAHVNLTVPSDGRWHEWPTGKGAPSGGLYFLTMFAERTEIGHIYTRLRGEPGRELFAIGLWFRGMVLT